MEGSLIMIMKSMVGLLASLLLVSTVAFGQQYETPFPQAANPALTNGAGDSSSAPAVRELPSSMAANQSSTDEEMSPSFTGSPFPSAANPSSR
jgi:hypothetical protein